MGALLRLSLCFPKTTCKERLSTILFHSKEIHSLEDLNNLLEVLKEGSERGGLMAGSRLEVIHVNVANQLIS